MEQVEEGAVYIVSGIATKQGAGGKLALQSTTNTHWKLVGHARTLAPPLMCMYTPATLVTIADLCNLSAGHRFGILGVVLVVGEVIIAGQFKL